MSRATLHSALALLVALALLLPGTPLQAQLLDDETDEPAEDETGEAADDELDDEDASIEDADASDEGDEEDASDEGDDDEVRSPYDDESDLGEAYDESDAGPPVPRTNCHGRRIVGIQVEGSRRVDANDIRATMRLRQGVDCSDEAVARDARRLWDLGFFEDLRIDADVDGPDVTLTVTVEERPAMARVVFEGNDEVEDDDLDEEVTLREGGILSIPDVRRQIEKIRDLYAEEGYFLARVTYQITRLANDNNEVEVRFDIDEGEEVEVRRLRFVGNEHIDSDDLRGIMQTSQTSFFSFISSNNHYDSEAFEEDVTRIQAYYYDQGYLGIRVSNPRVELTSDRRYIDVTIPVEEGPRYRIGELEVSEVDESGQSVDALEDDLRGEVDLDTGDYFSRTKVALGIQEITRIYRDAGYARVEVTPETQLDAEGNVVDLRLAIVRGPLVHIERIVIRGNTKTRDRVIRRELRILEGAQYNQSDIELSKRRVNALGYFERVDVSEESGTSPDLMVLTFTVVEKPTGTFQVGAGFSSIEQFIVTAQIQQQNLFGNGQSLSLQLQLSGVRQLVQIQLVEPYFLNTQWLLSGDIFKTIRQYSFFTRDSTGAGFTFGHPIVDPRLRFSLGYRFEYIDVSAGTGGIFSSNRTTQATRLYSQSSISNTFRDGITSSLRLTLSWDNRDNRIVATDGWYASYSAELAERFLGSQQLFFRQNAFVRFYRRIWGPLVFKANLQVGLITSRQNQGVPLYERYYLGGIFNIRGFALNTVGPRAQITSSLDPNGLISQAGNGYPAGVGIGGNFQAFYQLEVEFPILTQVGIRGVIFADGGNAWNLEQRLCEAPVSDDIEMMDPCGIDLTDIRTSVGFGLRWFSPLGPLRFEWGIPINRRSWEDVIRFEFTIGNSF